MEFVNKAILQNGGMVEAVGSEAVCLRINQFQAPGNRQEGGKQLEFGEFFTVKSKKSKKGEKTQGRNRNLFDFFDFVVHFFLKSGAIRPYTRLRA
jgi:hypothetical protein